MPGWTVQDNLSHMASWEGEMSGRPLTEHRAADLSNAKNQIGEENDAIGARASGSPVEKPSCVITANGYQSMCETRTSGGTIPQNRRSPPITESTKP